MIFTIYSEYLEFSLFRAREFDRDSQLSHFLSAIEKTPCLQFGLKDQDLCAVTIKSTSITPTVEGVTTSTPALTMVLRDVTDDLTYQSSDKTYNAPQSAGNKFSILSADSNATTDTFKGLLSGVGIFTSTGNGTDVTNQAIATAMGAAPMLIVPDPATATLSLLALAGLAARRRRK